MAEETKAVTAEVSAESSIENSTEPAGESAATGSNEHSQTKGEHTRTRPAAEVEKASPSVDATTDKSRMHEAEGNPLVEDGVSTTANDTEVDGNACDTEHTAAPPSDDMTNPKDCGGDANDASENAANAPSERYVDGDGIADKDKNAAPTGNATEFDDSKISEDGNDKAAAASSGMMGPTTGNDAEVSPSASSSPRSKSEQKDDAKINCNGASPRTWPWVTATVTSNLIGMTLSGRSGLEQLRPMGSDGTNSDHEVSLSRIEKAVQADQASMGTTSTLGSSIPPNVSPSRTPGRKRRRPGISPSQRSTSGDDADSGAWGKVKDSLDMARFSGLHDGYDQGMKMENGSESDAKSMASAFLVEHHANHFLLLNLTSAPANGQTAALFHNQIINCPWTAFDLAKNAQSNSSTGNDTNSCSNDQSDRYRSPSTPSLSALLEICYIIAAYQALGSQNVAGVYCSNGRTRTGVAIACYLKYSGRVRTSLDGFRLFCAKCNDSEAESKASPALSRERGQRREEQDVASLIPPSLLQLFRNFDDLVDLQAWPNPQPLRLRAVTMQNVPVDDLPVVEIWSGAKGQIYNSQRNDCSKCDSKMGLLGASAQWGRDNEEGFYFVDKDIQGEFTLTCRFGGPYADDTHGITRILFRVSNHCAFFTWGPNELRKGRVDIMRRYVDSFEDDFALVLLFEPIGGLGPSTTTTESYLPPIMGGITAIEQGLRLITAHHSLQIEGGGDNDDLTSGIARRLANNDDTLIQEVSASPQMVGIQNAITAHKSLTQNEQIRFNPIIPTSKAPDAENLQGNSTGFVGQSNDLGSNVVDPQGTLLSAIVTRGKDDEISAEKTPVDPRAALLSAIKSKSNGASGTTKSEEKVPVDARAALLGAIKTRKTDHTTENGGADPRVSMLAVIRTRQRSEDADEKSEKEEMDPSPPPVGKDASMPSPLDPRAAMLSAISARKQPDDDDECGTTTEAPAAAMPSPAPALDPRAAMLSAISARKQPDDDDEGDTLAEAPAAAKPSPAPAPALDPRAAMLSAISARKQPDDDDEGGTIIEAPAAAQPSPSPAPAPAPTLDPRAAMLSAIKAKQKISEDNKSKSAEDATISASTTSAVTPGDRILVAMKSRGTDDKSSQLLDLLDTVALGCDDTLEPESNDGNAESECRFHPTTVDYVPYDQPFMPSPGDVLNAFGFCPPSSSSNQTDQISPVKSDMPDELYSRPLLPLHPSKESYNLRPMERFLAQFESREDIASCIELLDKMPRSGIQIDDLMHLLAQSRRWSRDELNRIRQTMAMRQSVIADASLTREGAAANAAAALAGQFQIASGQFAAGASAGPSKGARAAADAVSQRLENSASVSQIAKDINGEENKAGSTDGSDNDTGDPKLKDDPLYSKYFRMLNVGLPVGAVKNALQRDGQDPSVMDLDQNRPIQIQLDERNKYRDFEMSEWM